MPLHVSSASSVQSASLSAVVIRCGCGDPDGHNGLRGPAGPCPRPRATEDLGVVAYYHCNPLRRLLWHLRQQLARRR